ncbi:Cytochrome c-type biogenesis protein CcmE, heme chaperone [invertebrate metagenome]|uniref:Cytochrome c-type biogenesis protein CcmE, heme chaperone n=1 Tax=invertebrate metagenome TaxID=1711999 RepID=A0A484H4C9_9ZZZZ
MDLKQLRLAWVVFSLGALGIATSLILLAARDSVMFFFSPSELARHKITPDHRLRVGGLVAAGSVQKNGQITRFIITDVAQGVLVTFAGILPDLFREGQGVVAEGRVGTDGVLHASDVLAKHDETYTPREVAKALKESGQWRGSTQSSPAPNPTAE